MITWLVFMMKFVNELHLPNTSYAPMKYKAKGRANQLLWILCSAQCTWYSPNFVNLCHYKQMSIWKRYNQMKYQFLSKMHFWYCWQLTWIFICTSRFVHLLLDAYYSTAEFKLLFSTCYARIDADRLIIESSTWALMTTVYYFEH